MTDDALDDALTTLRLLLRLLPPEQEEEGLEALGVVMREVIEAERSATQANNATALAYAVQRTKEGRP